VAVGNEPIGQLAADHPGRASHCDMHSDPPLVFRRSLITRGLPSGKNISHLVKLRASLIADCKLGGLPTIELIHIQARL
jgi:hypothetical protein